MKISKFSRRSFFGASIGAVAASALGLPAAGATEVTLSSAANSWRKNPLLAARQHVIYSYPGLVPPTELLDIIHQGPIGGIIFFGENISSIDQIAKVAQQLQDAALHGAAKRPLMLSVDQEGGFVNRLPGGPEETAADVGRATEPVRAAESQATTIAEVLASAKMNTDLAPVLGVYRQPDDFLDHYGRSFSQDHQVVSNAGEAFIQRLQNSGVLATAKHFPGLGAAPHGADTDRVPVRIELSEKDLRDVDIFPYQAAIKAGVSMVMPSWAIYPAFDPELPAGLSEQIISGILRGKCDFRGVTITDALEAGSLRSFGDTGERAVKAIRAGNDLLCCSARSISQGEEAAQGLVAGFTSGRLDVLTLFCSQLRISKLASKLQNLKPQGG